MRNINIKSKKGFTLIELLVVIGILAVLAAIAIPSIAGLIDRANVSADNTNANEMTNAMERFVSEYELFRQDIASGTFDVNNMDAAQGRVYNVTGADSIEDIRALESEAGFNGIRIDIDNKYAQNHATAKKVIENYMKTSSSTFEPKQSDMTYWYNTVTGYTVVAEKDINTATLQNLLPQEIRYGKSQPASMTEWVDLNSDLIIPDIRTTDLKAALNSNSKPAFKFFYCFPNPKYNDIDLLNMYVIMGDYKEDEPIDFNNNKLKYCMGEEYSSSNHNYINNQTGALVNMTITQSVLETSLDKKFAFRFCYKVNENGVDKYYYTASFVASYNELLKNQ